jgi:hypothetical protein
MAQLAQRQPRYAPRSAFPKRELVEAALALTARADQR